VIIVNLLTTADKQTQSWSTRESNYPKRQ